MPVSSDRQVVLVPLRGGVSVDLDVLRRLLDLEAKGGRFQLLPAGQFRVVPATLLTADDVTFLRAHRDEARRIISYEADDSHIRS